MQTNRFYGSPGPNRPHDTVGSTKRKKFKRIKIPATGDKNTSQAPETVPIKQPCLI